jgi:hypothetical protein
MTNVVEFKPKNTEEKEAQMQKEEKEKLKNHILEIKDGFFSTIEKTEEEVMDYDAVLNALDELEKENVELSFRTENEALVVATALLSLPEFEDVSHFRVVSNISRKSVFLTLEPVYKDETKFMFPSEDLMQGLNLMNLNNELKRLEE